MTTKREVLQELMAREPLFHHREFVHSRESFDDATDEAFWEVGASGQVYSRDRVREVILDRLSAEPQDEMVSEGWTTEDHHLRELSDHTYLFTYVLRGQGRVTRRATVWRHDSERGWYVLYHQGTIVQDA